MVNGKRHRSVSNHTKRRKQHVPDSAARQHERDCQTSQSSSSSRVDSSVESSTSSSNGTSMDVIVHFDWYKGMYLGGDRRYEVRRKLGEGTFGRVLECIDHNRRSRVAVKVIRDVKRYVDNAKIEAKILERVNEIRRLKNFHQGGRGIVRLYDLFFHKDKYYCLSFEKLGKTLLDVIQMNNHMGMHIFDIQIITKELLEIMDFLHAECTLVHTDIKMENIMLTGFDFTETRPPPRLGRSGNCFYRPNLVSHETRGAHRSIRLIDFGNGVFHGDHHSLVVNTRQYRSPEVILVQPWDAKSDMWSVGCVVGELFAGELVFPTHSNLEHLAMIEKVVGRPIDDSVWNRTSRSIREKYLCKTRLNWPQGCESTDSFAAVQSAVPLKDMFYEYSSLYSLVSRLLRIDKDTRATAERALDSSFLSCRISFSE